MRDRNELERTLAQIDGRGYASFKQLRGTYRLGYIQLAIDQVQVDPYAPPSRMRILLDADIVAIPSDLTDDKTGKIATSDFLTRAFANAAGRLAPEPTGTGNSGLVSIGDAGQEVLERTSVLIADDRVEARVELVAPAPSSAPPTTSSHWTPTIHSTSPPRRTASPGPTSRGMRRAEACSPMHQHRGCPVLGH